MGKPKKKIKKTVHNPITLRKNVTIGSPDAEMDDEYLEECFFENENIETLLNTQTPQRIIVGRTGSGKTALIKQIERKTRNSISFSPQDFSFQYLADSSVLSFFEAAGVNLNIFYLLLWRHVICVELSKRKYDICNEEKMKNFLNSIRAKISGDKGKAEAIKYLQDWDQKFWKTTEIRIKEITQKLETELSANASINIKEILKLGASGVKKLTEEQRIEVVNIGKDVVNKVQVQKLSNVINLLDEEIFDDEKNPYYILIDKLDENWAEDSLRYKIIRALVDTIKKFQKVKNLKIIIALREDLLHRVLRETRDSGFQEEKIESLYLRLSWNKDELEKILDLRIERLFRRQYNKGAVKTHEILGIGKNKKHNSLEYILDRTFLRPREAILFINYCLDQSAGKNSIPLADIKSAELSYSRKRLRSLCDEWVVDYPLLGTYVNIFHNFKSSFDFEDIKKLTNLDDILLDAATTDEITCNRDLVCKISRNYLDGKTSQRERLLKSIICCFYQVGICGVKLAKNYPVEWSYISEPVLAEEQIKNDTKIHIHPTFWCALNLGNKDDTH